MADRVAIFGAGIAGLSAAHALIRRGYQVSVYEALPVAGGFFRSQRRSDLANIPSEYSWHGLGPWYHNTFDLLTEIPFDPSGSIFARGLSRPIDFGIFPNRHTAAFYDRRWWSIPHLFGFRFVDFIRWSWLMLKTWTAGRRSEIAYSRMNAAAAWRPLLGARARAAWSACFGPWIGSDWTRVSLHQAGHFFRKQLTSDVVHEHPADEDGPAWRHGAGDGWLLLRGPSSEVWFERWLTDLQRRGCKFVWNAPLNRMAFDGNRIQGAELEDGSTVSAEHYIVAVNPYAAAQVFSRTPTLAAVAEVDRFQPLTQDEPHVQVSFRIGFSEAIRFPRKRTAVVVSDSEFNLTLFAQEQAWRPDQLLGEGIQSLWTGTSCTSKVPGRIFGRAVERCTWGQFAVEVKAQILRCGALDRLVREANGGRPLKSFAMTHFEVWPEWHFSESGIRGSQPKWVNSTRTQAHQPAQRTPVPNLLLAGAHTRTEADVWSVEAAVESGRRAAQVIAPGVRVLGQRRPVWLRAAAWLDDRLFHFGAPHLMDLALAAGVALVGAVSVVLIQKIWLT